MPGNILVSNQHRLRGRLAARLQPTTDDPKGLIASTIDGLLYGAGDAVIGINPASDNVGACIQLLEVIQAVREHYHRSRLSNERRDSISCSNRSREAKSPIPALVYRCSS